MAQCLQYTYGYLSLEHTHKILTWWGMSTTSVLKGRGGEVEGTG